MKPLRPFCLNIAVSITCLSFFGMDLSPSFTRPATAIPIIKASVKTDDVETAGDAADDVCIYVNQYDRGKSLVIGTDKKSGLGVYDLSGNRLQVFPDGHLNNVDISHGFDLGGRPLPLVSAGNRSTNTIDFYYIDLQLNILKRLSVREHGAHIKVYGSCMYKSPISQKTYVFVNNKDGEVIQWEITAQADSTLSLTNVRTFNVGGQVEGCVADNDLAHFYIAEEGKGIWRYGAEPSAQEERKSIDSTGRHGHLVADVEGLTIYQREQGEGYLLASNQGESAFNIYDRKTGDFIGKFHIEYDGKRIKNTDGIDATSHHLGSSFPAGMLVVQDGNKSNAHQSFKYVSWEKVVTAFSLTAGIQPLRSHLDIATPQMTAAGFVGPINLVGHPKERLIMGI